MHKFHKFCTLYDVTSPFPLTEGLLCTYAAFLDDQHLSPQTIKSNLAALRNWQISLGLPNPRDNSSLPMLKRVQAGHQQTTPGKRTPNSPSAPSHSLPTHTNEELARQVVPPCQVVDVGSGNHGFLRFLPPRGTPLQLCTGVQRSHMLGMGRRGSRQPVSTLHGPNPPEKIQMRPVRGRGGCSGGSYWGHLMSRVRSTGLPEAEGQQQGPLLPKPGRESGRESMVC